MGGKKGGGQRTQYIAPNTLESKQKIKLIHLLCAGVINGWQKDDILKSIRFNDTYVRNDDGSFNFNNVRVNYLAGELDQDYLVGFDAIERTNSVGAQVTKRTPITRTILDPLVKGLRVTLGVNALFRQTDQGDMYGTHVDLSVQVIKNGQIYSSVLWSLNEKGNSPFKQDAVLNDLPEAPFDLKVVRITEDSTDDRLKNDTFFHSYVEVIPQKFSYPTCAVVGVELDAEQLGGQVPTINYEVFGREIQVPSNYDPETRKYEGMWDGSFKSAYTNNPAWVLYDVMTDEIHGLGRYFKSSFIDKMKLYEIGQYSDEMVDDGEGNKEPRYVFNGLIEGNDATTILHNICSVFRGRPVEKNGFISFIYDRGNVSPVATYTNANVIGGVFRYSHAPLDTRINSIQFEYADERDGCKLKVEEISNPKSIARLNRVNTQKITCYGQTKRSYAVRHAKWFLETSETEAESVTFGVGFQGLRHGAFDIIAIADNSKAGVPIGGRLLEVNGDTVRLDRGVLNALEIRIRNKIYKVKKQLSADSYQLDKAVDAEAYDVFSANTERATERLFKIISTEENEDGSYTVSAVKYNAKKMSAVDDAVSAYPEIETTYNTIPVLVGGNVNNQGDYLLLSWDSLSSVGVEMTYTVQLFKDNEHYQTYTTQEPNLKLYNLPMGEYYAKVKGRTKLGIYSEELIIPFSTTYTIHNLTYKPIVFGFVLSWQNPPLINSNAKIEVWVSDEDKADSYRKFATLAYPNSNHTIGDLSAGDELYCKVRIVDDKWNYGEFTNPILAKASTDADDMLSYLQGKITNKELDDKVVDQIIEEVIKDIDLENIITPEDIDKIIDDAIQGVKDNVDEIISESEIVNNINQKVDDAELDTTLLELSKVTSDRAVYGETQVNRVSIQDNYAEMILQKITEATADKQLASQYLSLVAENELARAEFMLSQMAETTNNKALVQEILSLTASFLGNEAQLVELREVFATEKEAVAQSIDKLTTDVDGNKSSIESVRKATSDLEKSTAESVNRLESSIDTNKSSINRVDKTLTDLSKSTAQSVENLHSEIDGVNADASLVKLSSASGDKALTVEVNTLTASYLDNKAQIQDVRRVIADESQATANSISKLESKVGDNSSKITQNSTTIANVDGTVKSQYTLTTEADVNGQKTVSGFTSINDGKTSEFIIQADKFAIVNKKNGETRMPFVIVDNKLGMDGDMIASGSITGNKLVAGTSIEAPIIKGGRVESGHFAGGSINIGNGNFTVDSNGNLFAKSGRFEGTVYAEKIEGDVVVAGTLNKSGGSVYIIEFAPIGFQRIVRIENLMGRIKEQGEGFLSSVYITLNDKKIDSSRNLGSSWSPIQDMLLTLSANTHYILKFVAYKYDGSGQGIETNLDLKDGFVTVAKRRVF